MPEAPNTLQPPTSRESVGDLSASVAPEATGLFKGVPPATPGPIVASILLNVGGGIGNGAGSGEGRNLPLSNYLDNSDRAL